MFFKLPPVLVTVVALGGCVYEPEAMTAAMAPVRLSDGSYQQTVMAAVQDRNCLGPTVVQMVTYHAPQGGNLRPIAEGTVSGNGQCVAVMDFAGNVIGGALMSGDTTLTALSAAQSTSTAVAVAAAN